MDFQGIVLQQIIYFATISEVYDEDCIAVSDFNGRCERWHKNGAYKDVAVCNRNVFYVRIVDSNRLCYGKNIEIEKAGY